MMNKEEEYIFTYTGKKVHIFDPRPEEFDIRDIAHGLAFNCRFSGHTRKYYSVAEHSVIMAMFSSSLDVGLHCLLHDASEAYLRDLASPIKRQMPEYKLVENRLQRAILEAFGLDPASPNAEVHELDERAFWAEVKHLMPKVPHEDWLITDKPNNALPVIPVCWGPETAEQEYLLAFQAFTEKMNEESEAAWKA